MGALSIMGVDGGSETPGNNSKKFAEIIAASVLAGELNLLAALASRELGKAHSQLGETRNKNLLSEILWSALHEIKRGSKAASILGVPKLIGSIIVVGKYI